MIPVERNFLELRDIKKLKFNSPKENKFLIKKIKPDFQLNKFFYKQVGKKSVLSTLTMLLYYTSFLFQFYLLRVET